MIAVSEDGFCPGDTLALAGGQVLWGGFREVKCSDDYWIVATGPPGAVIDHRSYGCDQGGSTPPAIAGAGDNLYYSYVDYEESADCVDSGGTCLFTAAGGSLVRVSHGKKTRLRGVPPAALLAAAPERLAIVRAAKRFSHAIRKPKPPGTYPLPATGPLDVRDSAGRLLRTIPLPSPAEALAVTQSLVAVVTSDHGRRTLRWYGNRSGSIPLGNARTISLAADGERIVVETGTEILAIDSSGRRTASWRLGGAPAGLSIDRGHVLWAENRDGRGRILDARLS